MHNQFVNLDDDELITENPIVQDFSKNNLKYAFTHHQMGHYLPITTLTYQLSYFFFKNNPTPYHIFSLIIHVLNIFLIYLILKKLKIKDFTVIFTCLVFALHPLNVESVSWISARSNILYFFFYLLSVYSYISYSGLKKNILTFLFFLLSCLSKSAAVTLPITLFMIDWYNNSSINIKKSIISKIPYLLISICFGLLAIHFSKQFGTFEVNNQFLWYDKLFLSSYALLFYIVKFFFPIHLSAIHFFPDKAPFLPWLYYTAFPIVLSLFGIIIYFIKKNKLSRVFTFGILWFIIHLFLVLQWLSIGNVITTERYVYAPYVGLSLIFFHLLEKNILSIGIRWFIVGFMGLIFLGITYNRTKVWENSYTLYTDVIDKYPDKGYGYYGRGIYLLEQQHLDSAIRDFTLAIDKEKYFPNAYLNRGNTYLMMNKIHEAKRDYKTVLDQKSTYKEAYFNLGYINYKENNYDQAIEYFLTGLNYGIKSNNLYYYLGLSYYHKNMKTEACKYLSLSNNFKVMEAYCR